jgi:homogentisate 1,2-dioxygenase
MTHRKHPLLKNGRQIYLVTISMTDDHFFSVGSELLIVPQEGRLASRLFSPLGPGTRKTRSVCILRRFELVRA